MDELTNETSETPTPLPRDVMGDSVWASSPDMPLHLRVLKMIVQGQADEERLQQALDIAHEIYELETAGVALDEYRSVPDFIGTFPGGERCPDPMPPFACLDLAARPSTLGRCSNGERLASPWGETAFVKCDLEKRLAMS